MMTALVLLPYVASIKLLLSLATWMMRFIGADSGDTIEIIRCAETTLPKPILISCKAKAVPPFISIQVNQFHNFKNQYDKTDYSYSIFCTCSFIFSISLFIVTTASLTCASTDFAPIVFTSRCISCVIKSSFRPIAPSALTTDAKCCR